MAFGPIVISYDNRVLEPRPWTLAQAEWASELATHLPPGPILELCCGAGHIGQAAASLAGRPIVQVDVDPWACTLARSNAERNGLADHVEVREGPLDAMVRDDERFGLILADPPYIPSDHVSRFPEDPVLAIDGGHDGLELVRAALSVGADHLSDGGVMVLQLGGDQQVSAGADLASALGLVIVGLRLLRHDRGLVAVALRP